MAAERGREEERLRREAEEEERERRANKKKRKATENLAPQERNAGQWAVSLSLPRSRVMLSLGFCIGSGSGGVSELLQRTDVNHRAHVALS